MKVAIMAGGTGGHVFPALAVAERLRDLGHEVVWMGTRDGLEARVVPEQGFGIEWITIHGLRGRGLGRWLGAPLRLLRALVQALRILHRQRPAVVLGMGGFAAGPGGVAAWLLRQPLVIHEQNAAAGMTNRWLSRLARRGLQAFPGALPKAHTVGNPVRADFAHIPAPAQRLAGRTGAMRLLVLGGSQGARALNECVPQALAQVPPVQRPAVWHQGGRTLDTARTAYQAAGVQARLDAFIDDMPAAYAWADLVLCRAGAMTVAELAAAGVGAVLVPFPHATDDHQTRNAGFLVRAGAALLLPERELDTSRLAALVAQLGADRARLLAMAQAARAVASPGALEAIVEALLQEGAA
jgi:UDP-N-acetylglucosamine--N-acetylmuramyl-(pentapeptide) pyrophosphoryl-undecaprenol N-acetylglucosamine transferase